MPGKLGKKIAELFKKGTKKTKDVLKEIKYNVRDKGTIRDMKWKERNPEGYHYNMIRKNKPYSGTGSNQYGGEPVFNKKGMRVPGMVQDGGSVVNAANEVRNSKRMNQSEGSFEGYTEYMESLKGKKARGKQSI